MPTFSDALSIDTAIGQIQATATVSAGSLSGDQISFTAFNIDPQFPLGMRVNTCNAILLVVEGSVDLDSVKIDVNLNSDVLGTTCNGQGLDAQEWSANGKLLVIGTEDGEWLSHRYPDSGLDDTVVVEFSTRSMTLSLTGLGILKNPSFHFIIAENDDPEPVASSAWFAVDQKHEYILSRS